MTRLPTGAPEARAANVILTDTRPPRNPPSRRLTPGRRGWPAGSANRSRRGSEPISSRNSTDLEPELDRSRRGSEPISTRNSTDLGGRGSTAPPDPGPGAPPTTPAPSPASGSRRRRVEKPETEPEPRRLIPGRDRAERPPRRQRTFPTPTYLSRILLRSTPRRMGERYVHVGKVRSRSPAHPGRTPRRQAPHRSAPPRAVCGGPSGRQTSASRSARSPAKSYPHPPGRTPGGAVAPLTYDRTP